MLRKRFLQLSLGLLCFVPARAIADTDTNDDEDIGVELNLEDFPVDEDAIYETVVVGTPAAEEGLSRTRIKQEQIRRQGSKTAAEVVEHEPAVFAQSGKKGERSFRLRGFDQRGVATYWDGVPFTTPYGGSVDLGKIPAQMLGSVLLIKGPTSIKNAPGGMGGAVLLETRDPTTSPFFELDIQGNHNFDGNASLYHSYNPGPVSYALGVGATSSDGYRLSSQFDPTYYEDGGTLNNSDHKTRHGAGKFIVPLHENNEIQAQIMAIDGQFGIPRSTTDNRPFFSRYDVWRAMVTQLGHKLETTNFKIEEAAYAAFYNNKLDSFDDNTFTTMDGPNAYSSWYRDRSFGGVIKGQYAIRSLPSGSLFLRLWLGIEHDIHNAKLDTDEPNNKFSRTLFTIVPEIQIPIHPKLTAIASMQTDLEIPDTKDAVVEGYDEDLKDEFTAAIAPLLALRWDPRDNLMLRLSGARRNRIPTLSERYSSRLGFTRANPQLEPESAWHVGLDINWKMTPCFNVELSGFDAEVDNMINKEYLPETNGVTQKQNIGRARLAGAEIAIDYHPIEQLRFTIGYAYLYARRLNNSDDEDRIAQIPAHQAILGIITSFAKWIELSSYMRIVGPQAFDDYNILGLGELGTYAVWDARLEIKPNDQVTLWLSGNNLLDMNYQTSYGYPDSGISAWAGARVTIH